MTDERGAPPRRLPRREPARPEDATSRPGEGASPAVAVRVLGPDVELEVGGTSMRVSRTDARRLLAALLETLG